MILKKIQTKRNLNQNQNKGVIKMLLGKNALSKKQNSQQQQDLLQQIAEKLGIQTKNPNYLPLHNNNKIEGRDDGR